MADRAGVVQAQPKPRDWRKPVPDCTEASGDLTVQYSKNTIKSWVISEGCRRCPRIHYYNLFA